MWFNSNLYHSASLHTVSKAFSKSTKAQNSFSFFFLRSQKTKIMWKNCPSSSKIFGNQIGFRSSRELLPRNDIVFHLI
jgi:hypothetical protein